MKTIGYAALTAEAPLAPFHFERSAAPIRGRYGLAEKHVILRYSTNRLNGSRLAGEHW